MKGALTGLFLTVVWIIVGYVGLRWLAQRFFTGRYRPEVAAAAVVGAFALGVNWPESGPVETAVSATDAPMTPAVDPARTAWSIDGRSRRLRVTIAGARDAASLQWIHVLVNAQLNGVSACYAIVDPARGRLLLADDAGRLSESAGVHLGVVHPLGNSQCVVDAAHATVVAKDGLIVFSLPVSVTADFARRGTLRTWIRTQASGAAPSDWTEITG